MILRAEALGRGLWPAFLALAFTYFLSALLRAVMATLAPVFNAELGLRAAELGLLAGAYFIGFAATQLPLGQALDSHGPRRTLLSLISLAVLGCGLFALADRLAALVAARALIGAGLGACLMAALKIFRTTLDLPGQQRANAWMLMIGSLGMVTSTVPVQLLQPLLGWRGLFWGLAGLLLVAMLTLALTLPDPGSVPARAADEQAASGYAEVLAHPLFRRYAPLGFFYYGGLLAVQTLWAGPWLTQVSGWTSEQAARGLLGINLSMLVAFALWGWVRPSLTRSGWDDDRLMRSGLALSLLLLFGVIGLGQSAAAAHWAVWCVSATFATLAQPAIGAAFPAALAGRALSAFNLVVFCGVFCVQWGVGLVMDVLQAQGLSPATAMRSAFCTLALCCLAAYGWFLRAPGAGPHNPG